MVTPIGQSQNRFLFFLRLTAMVKTRAMVADTGHGWGKRDMGNERLLYKKIARKP